MKRLFQVIFMLVAFACSTGDQRNEILASATMVEVLIDIHLAEAGVQDLRLSPDSAAVVFATQEKLIFKKYNITDSAFLNSYNFYVEHPERMEEIYAAVIDSLSLRQVLMRESAGE